MIYNLDSHPLVSRTVAALRNQNTPPDAFRLSLRKLGRLMAYEMAEHIPTSKFQVTSPLGVAEFTGFSQKISVIGILRAALPMMDGIIDQFPESMIGFISASRGKMIGDAGTDFEILVDYSKLPDVDFSTAIIVDPMLASASTLLYAIDQVKKQSPAQIMVACAIAAQYGVNRLSEHHPDIKIFAGAIDEKLNDKGYIVPGLGDAGDRAFNTAHS